MKITHLLKQYLYQNNKLELPRIGIFTLQVTDQQFPENHKQHGESLSEIIFEYDNSTVADPELITFISENTGKMKALATSDLDSFIEISIQFLNIGKMFKLDGIGTLIKTKQNVYAFTPEKLISGKTIELAKHSQNSSLPDDDYSNFDTTNVEKPSSVSLKKIILLLVIIVGLTAIVWSIIYLFNWKTLEKTDPNSSAIEQSIIPVFEDSIKKDSLLFDSVKTVNSTNGKSNFKFVLETTNKQRAFDRYNQLKTYNWDIKLETKDSLVYKLYVIIHGMPIDTIRIKDSLNLLYGNKVKIENK